MVGSPFAILWLSPLGTSHVHYASESMLDSKRRKFLSAFGACKQFWAILCQFVFSFPMLNWDISRLMLVPPWFLKVSFFVWPDQEELGVWHFRRVSQEWKSVYRWLEQESKLAVAVSLVGVEFFYVFEIIPYNFNLKL